MHETPLGWKVAERVWEIVKLTSKGGVTSEDEVEEAA